MATDETATEPVEDEQITTRNRHATSEPVDGVQTLADAVTEPQKNRHATSEPAD